MLIALLVTASASAGAMFGIEYVPAGLGDMAWVEESQLSGNLVAERDGLLVPPLRSMGGYVWGRHGVFGGIAIARISTTVINTDNQATSTRMATRPSIEYRFWVVEPVAGQPLFYVTGGVHGVIPFAAETAEGASKEDRAALAEAAEEAKGRIGGIGASVGLGAEVRFDNGLGLGIRTSVIAFRSESSNQQTQTVSSLIRPETAVTLSYWF